MPTSAPVHISIGHQTASQRKAEYIAHRPSPSRVYGRRWQALRRAYLAQHPDCECGCGYAASVVDHRIPHCGDLALMYDWANLQAMTKACHDRKTVLQDGGFGNARRRLGYGGLKP